eukprot:1138677-Pelagomonas_calceolata.AAC.5
MKEEDAPSMSAMPTILGGTPAEQMHQNEKTVGQRNTPYIEQRSNALEDSKEDERRAKVDKEVTVHDMKNEVLWLLPGYTSVHNLLLKFVAHTYDARNT